MLDAKFVTYGQKDGGGQPPVLYRIIQYNSTHYITLSTTKYSILQRSIIPESALQNSTKHNISQFKLQYGTI